MRNRGSDGKIASDERRRAMAAMRTMGLAPVLPPDARVTERTREYVISLPVLGFTPQELEVEIADHIVTIRGNQARTAGDNRSFKLHEKIEESFRLPDDVDTDDVTAFYTHRTIELHAPRVSARPSRKVPIRRRPTVNAEVTGL
jgi:HSP20 family molecular chaperone IbpA